MYVSSKSQYGLVCKSVLKNLFMDVYSLELIFFPLLILWYHEVFLRKYVDCLVAYRQQLKIIMVRDFPLKYLQVFLITYWFGFFLLFELALVHVQTFNL